MLVISSCTGDKAVDLPGALRLQDLVDPVARARREAALQAFRRPASHLYTGEQHRHAMQGIGRLRARYGPDFVSLKIVSAGFGLVDEKQMLTPYNVTFNAMGRKEARAWAQRLKIPADVRSCLAPFPLVVILLGERYLDAIVPPLAAAADQRLIYLAKPSLSAQLKGPRVTVVAAGRPEATRYGSGLVALKGRMFDLFAAGLLADSAIWDDVASDDSPRSFVKAMAKGLGSS